MLVSSGPSECFVAGVYILIAAGALMMVVGFLGCCGAIKESPCMLGLVSDFFCVLLLHITLKTGDFVVNHEFMLRFFSWHISQRCLGCNHTDHQERLLNFTTSVLAAAAPSV